jgi:drug/metabolite transporter (DMT)-like permease
MALGMVAVLAFSGTFPAMRAASSQLDPTFVGLGRAVMAAALAAVSLLLLRAAPPTRQQLPRLMGVAAGVVVGFPWLTALALRSLPAGHGAVMVGALPAMTAVAATLRARERPSLRFWLISLAGLGAVLGYAAVEGAGGPAPGDLWLIVGVLLGAIGYAEGGALAREMAGWRVISWALLLALPVTLAGTVVSVLAVRPHAGADAWAGFLYAGIISMYLAFFAWYEAMGRAGIARVGQLQLAQPVLSVILGALLLHEAVGVATVVTALLIIPLVALAVRERVAVMPAAADGR